MTNEESWRIGRYAQNKSLWIFFKMFRIHSPGVTVEANSKDESPFFRSLLPARRKCNFKESLFPHVRTSIGDCGKRFFCTFTYSPISCFFSREHAATNNRTSNVGAHCGRSVVIIEFKKHLLLILRIGFTVQFS